MLQISNVWGVRFAGVFMISLATIWIRTRLMPRWLAVVTYLLAVVLLLVVSRSLWITLVFPAWVCGVSTFILIRNRTVRRLGPTAQSATGTMARRWTPYGQLCAGAQGVAARRRAAKRGRAARG